MENPKSQDSKFVKYKPSAFDSDAKERVIRLVEMPVEPLEPPKFKHRKVPKESGSPPPVTVKEDQQDWKIPPCISNWKNPKGYTIPLDKRLAADGKGLQDVQINDNLAKLSEDLYIAEQKAREAVVMRSKVHKIMKTESSEPDTQFVGTSERSGPRDRPVEFVEVEEADPFITEVKNGEEGTG